MLMAERFSSSLSLLLSDSRMSNPSETNKCAMESGDGNTGELPVQTR